MPGLYQASFDLATELPESAYDYGARSSGETHGVVLTKPHVVSLILDLAGYTIDRDLPQLRLLEPSCGKGAFMVAAVERLLTVARRQGTDLLAIESPLLAFDIDESSVEATKAAVTTVLEANGVDAASAQELAGRWIHRCDFLLRHEARRFDVIVGNPPYVRIEQLSARLQSEYRARYRSLYDRADLYVAFIERALQLLSPSGVLSFICADRWTVNKYGAPLREIITGAFRVACYVDLHSASPFESDVVAYPSIFSVTAGSGGPVQTCTLATASREECEAVLPSLAAGAPLSQGLTIATYESWFSGTEPWIITSPKHLSTLRSLESRFISIEATGKTRIRIGVATGDDKVYIVDETADIEPDRLVPLVMRSDIDHGEIKDAGRFVINTFRDDGGLIDLGEYPRLAAHFEANATSVRRRHVSQKNPASWFRTIDRVYPRLVGEPKLLVPDIAGANEVVYERGRFLPHHNLYFVTSDEWDMEVLGGLLSSKVALFFVWSYAVKMRGGYLRFQAQYLRRIRVPSATAISPAIAESIRNAFRARDFERLDDLAMEVYSLEALPEFDFVDTRS